MQVPLPSLMLRPVDMLQPHAHRLAWRVGCPRDAQKRGVKIRSEFSDFHQTTIGRTAAGVPDVDLGWMAAVLSTGHVHGRRTPVTSCAALASKEPGMLAKALSDRSDPPLQASQMPHREGDMPRRLSKAPFMQRGNHQMGCVLLRSLTRASYAGTASDTGARVTTTASAPQ
jgi:hypothetical protein